MNRRNTAQKRAVYDCLMEMGHPTATSLYDYVKARFPEISRSTVFRILKEWASDGEALRFSVGDGEDRFDATTRVHYHILCVGCGRVEDADLAPMSQLLEFRDKDHGFQILGHTASFRGLCPDCMKKQG